MTIEQNIIIDKNILKLIEEAPVVQALIKEAKQEEIDKKKKQVKQFIRNIDEYCIGRPPIAVKNDNTIVTVVDLIKEVFEDVKWNENEIICNRNKRYEYS